ncbi:hypothetical protein QMK83_29780, partial [Klebsiella pneumoniae]|uniref:DUF6596 domain-containing protein n=1 Tax=Klebsiella pneumoniae TaxID=573 RepID=UPI003A866CBE
ALMLLNDARRDARFESGELVLLADQDRSRWDAAQIARGREALDRIVAQVSNPVRWDLCMERFATLGATAVIELPPAGTLVGLAKRALKGVELLAVRTPDDLDAARTLIQEHSA